MFRPNLPADLLDGPHCADAGVVHQDRNRPQFPADLDHHAGHVGALGDVPLHRERAHPLVPDPGAYLPGGALVFLVVHGHVGAPAAERDGNRPPDAATCPGDQGDPAVQPVVHSRTSLDDIPAPALHKEYILRQPGHLPGEDPRLSAPSSQRVRLYRKIRL